MALVTACESGGSAGEPSTQPVTVLEAEDSTLLVEQAALRWVQCDNDRLLECTTLVVPMDYSNPDGQTIELAMARARADAQTRERTLLINPGGPGAAGIDVLSTIVRFSDIPAAVERSHDFVSFDPRGTGVSTPVRCNMDVFARQDIYPVSRAEIQRNLEINTEFSQECFDTEGEYLQQLGSMNVVRDMNEIRKALRLSQFDFLGYSYGTRLAALYMQTYPQFTGRFVLDGSMTPETGLADWLKGTLLPSQRNIETLANACRDGVVATCNPREFLAQLQSKADELGDGPNTGEAFLFFGILRFAAERPGFEQFLVGPLADYLETDDQEELESIVNLLGTGETEENPDLFSGTAYIGVFCADDPVRHSIETIEALQSSFNADSDLFSELLYSNVAVCTGWPASVDPIPRIATNQAPPSLVIGGPTDTNTPLIFAEQMAQAVGGQFLRSEHTGHTTVFSGRNRCTDSAVAVFLTSGALPATGVCEATELAGSIERSYQPSLHMHQ